MKHYMKLNRTGYRPKSTGFGTNGSGGISVEFLTQFNSRDSEDRQGLGGVRIEVFNNGEKETHQLCFYPPSMPHERVLLSSVTYDVKTRRVI